MYKSDDEQSRREFYYHENNIYMYNKKNNIENDDSMSRYTYVSYSMVFKKAIINRECGRYGKISERGLDRELRANREQIVNCEQIVSKS